MANNELLRPAEVEFSQFTATLIAETLDAIIEAQLGQEEKLRELQEIAGFDVNRYAQEVVTVEEVEMELARLFPSAERPCSVVEGAPYTPPERGGEESPPVQLTTGYIMKSEDWKRGDSGPVFTEAGYRHIFNHIRMNLAALQLANILQLVRRGIPRIIVDNGRINTKLTFRISQTGTTGASTGGRVQDLKAASLRTVAPLMQQLRPSLPYKLTVKPADLRRPELLRLSVNLVGEVEITFKTVSD